MSSGRRVDIVGGRPGAEDGGGDYAVHSEG
jgi:hypothetical protein